MERPIFILDIWFGIAKKIIKTLWSNDEISNKTLIHTLYSQKDKAWFEMILLNTSVDDVINSISVIKIIQPILLRARSASRFKFSSCISFFIISIYKSNFMKT